VEHLRFHTDDTSRRSWRGRRFLRVKQDRTDLFFFGGGKVAITPGGGQQLMVPASLIQSRSPVVEMLLGFAVSHAFALQGGVVLHAAAFELEGRRVLSLGLSGGGKSTLAAAALRAGGRVVSDDLLLAGQDDAGFGRVEALRKDLSLRAPSHRLLPPALARRLSETNFAGESRLMLQRQNCPECFMRGLRPDVILQTTVDRRLKKTRITPLTQADSLSVLIRSASPLFFSARYPAERAAMLPVLLRLAETIRGHRVRLGKDLMAAPETAMRALLDELV